MKSIAKYAVVFAFGLLAAYLSKPEPPPIYKEVIVTDTVIIEREPDTVRTFIDRIVTVQAAPRIEAIAPRGAFEHVQSFCKPLIVTDTVVADLQLLLRSVSHDPGWFWQKDKLLLTGPVNNGDLKALDFEVRDGFTARTTGDSVLVQYPRTALPRQLVEIFAPALTLLLIGRIF